MINLEARMHNSNTINMQLGRRQRNQTNNYLIVVQMKDGGRYFI